MLLFGDTCNAVRLLRMMYALLRAGIKTKVSMHLFPLLAQVRSGGALRNLEARCLAPLRAAAARAAAAAASVEGDGGGDGASAEASLALARLLEVLARVSAVADRERSQLTWVAGRSV